MACIRVWLQILCISVAHASPMCALFGPPPFYTPYRFRCIIPSGTVYKKPEGTCPVESNWDYRKMMVVTENSGATYLAPVESLEYSALPPRPMRWLCPRNAEAMPRMQVVYESSSQPVWTESVTLNPASKSIDEASADDFPMVDDCAATYRRFNKDSRERECWKFRQMPHFSRQFQNLDRTVGIAGMDSSYGKLSPNQQVPECMILTNKINFQQYSCFIRKELKDLQVWIRPTYKFYPRLSNRDSYLNLCVFIVQPDVNTESMSTYYHGFELDMPTYPKNNVKNITFPNLVKSDFTDVGQFGVYMKCREPKIVRENLFGSAYVTETVIYPETGKIHPVNIETWRTTSTCPDFVSHACFYNAYSFYGRPCSWVDKTGGGIVFDSMKFDMQDIMRLSNQDTLWDEFLSYGHGHFEVDLQGFKLQASYDKGDGGGFKPWTGSVNIANNYRIRISPETGYSCSGCMDPKNIYLGVKDIKLTETDENAYAPLECRVCLTNERVVISGNIGKITKDWNRCVECEKHEIRDSSPGKLSACKPCQEIDEIYPKRVVGTLECTACNHTQYFVYADPKGCKWLKYISEYITGFNEMSGLPIFYGADGDDPRDEFEDMSSGTKRLISVERKKYRNVRYAESWRSSTEAANCEYNVDKIVNYTAINMTNATRNTQPQKLYYRQWCGHHEIVRHKDALLRKQQMLPFRVDSSSYVTLQMIKRDCFGTLTVLVDDTKKEMVDKRIAEFECKNASHQFYYEIRRDGQSLPCTVCPGFLYTKQCWPTYHPGMSTVDAVFFSTDTAKPSSGTCQQCLPRCNSDNQFFNVSLFSCWSNGTTRIAGGDHGRLDLVQDRASKHSNYWYKEAVCSDCPTLHGFEADQRQPALVTRCGNKVSFETWHPEEVVWLNGVNLPKIRACCSLKDQAATESSVAPTYDQNLDAYCITKENNAALSCAGTIPDLATETQPYCPPGWFVIETCAADSAVWTPKCCSKCDECSLGKVKTREYRECPGDTFFDTQSEGCKIDCLSGNYRDGDFCYPCETCMT